MMCNRIGWPLGANCIRRGKMGTFGLVRNNGTKPHHGWDLYANPGTTIYTVDDGVVEYAGLMGDYGLTIDIKLDSKISALEIFVRYAHLSVIALGLRHGTKVSKDQIIGFTGRSGNASKLTKSIDNHLHFEFLNTKRPRRGRAGLNDRFDPKDIYGVVPMNQSMYDYRVEFEPNDGLTIAQRVA